MSSWVFQTHYGPICLVLNSCNSSTLTFLVFNHLPHGSRKMESFPTMRTLLVMATISATLVFVLIFIGEHSTAFIFFIYFEKLEYDQPLSSYTFEYWEIYSDVKTLNVCSINHFESRNVVFTATDEGRANDISIALENVARVIQGGSVTVERAKEFFWKF